MEEKIDQVFIAPKKCDEKILVRSVVNLRGNVKVEVKGQDRCGRLTRRNRCVFVWGTDVGDRSDGICVGYRHGNIIDVKDRCEAQMWGRQVWKKWCENKPKEKQVMDNVLYRCFGQVISMGTRCGKQVFSIGRETKHEI